MLKHCFLPTVLLLILNVSLLSAHEKAFTVETAGSQMVFTVDKAGDLRIVHYGAPCGAPEQYLGSTRMASIPYGQRRLAYPAAGGKFLGQPALHVRYADGRHNTELKYLSHEVSESGGAVSTSILLEDPLTGVQVRLVYDAYSAEDVIVSHSEITNKGKKPVELLEYASSALTLEADKYLLTHITGGWACEMQVDRTLLTHDVKVLESRRGTQVTQTGNPSFMVSLDSDSFSETSGEVIAGALAWSGNFRISFEVDEGDKLNIVSGINPFASAWTLGKGETLVTPEMIYTWSGEGAGQASRNLHRWARNCWIHGGGQVHPTLLNSWEGAYFDFNTDKLLRMIDDAAGMGLEMFVLDDGWFGSTYPRNGDKSGLGDWEVNLAKIPEGIDYIASYAHSKGLKFGIWIEPEMVNPASTLAKQHPEWIVKDGIHEVPEKRNQWVLDLSNPAVQDFVFGVFDRTMQLSKNIDYVKWDCNRAVFSFGSEYLGKNQDRFYVQYYQGFYSVVRRIREKYPDVIVQCCSSGGGRVDYGALKYFDEVWPSDNTDALSRVKIQYGTSLIYPACIMASHVSAVPNHQTGNVTPLKMRFDIAAAGRLGMELQPADMSAKEREYAARSISSYEGFRDLVFGGDLYRLESPYDGDYSALMYVSPDRDRAVLFVYCLEYQNRVKYAKAVHLQGLDPEASYVVKEQNLSGGKSCFYGDGKSFTGSFLMGGGFEVKLLKPGDSAVFVIMK